MFISEVAISMSLLSSLFFFGGAPILDLLTTFTTPLSPLDYLMGNEGTYKMFGDSPATIFTDMDIENDINILGLILQLILILIGKSMLMLPDTEPRKCLI